MRWPRPGRVLAVAALAAGTAGCKTYRVERYKGPTLAQALGDGPREITLEDGTVVVYATPKVDGSPGLRREGEGKPLRIREEREDGTIVLRAWLPQDVLANMLTCLRNREYELFWEQMVSETSKMEYEHAGMGMTDFASWCGRNRNELAATLTRMLTGLQHNEAYLQNRGAGVVRCRLVPAVAAQFQFTIADVISEPGGLRLLAVK